jgi:hypothetical protein
MDSTASRKRGQDNRMEMRGAQSAPGTHTSGKDVKRPETAGRNADWSRYIDSRLKQFSRGG